MKSVLNFIEKYIDIVIIIVAAVYLEKTLSPAEMFFIMQTIAAYALVWILIKIRKDKP